MDLKELSDKLGLEVDEFVEIVELFVSTAVSDIEMLQAGFLSGDITQVSEAAHSIKGSAGNLGFEEISRIAGCIEEDVNSDCLENVEDGIDKMKNVLEEINKALD